ncbi:MAG TPA: hypothetical protein VFV05_15575 [Methylomirabilota bacterium]|nr:hypothetical protein [Methylomirabilota bacterium]
MRSLRVKSLNAVATTGTNVYTGSPFLLRKPSLAVSIVVLFQSVGTVTGNLSFEVSLDDLQAVEENRATWHKVNVAIFSALAGTAITFTTGDGAVTNGITSLFTIASNVMNCTAIRAKFTNATDGADSVTCIIQDKG